MKKILKTALVSILAVCLSCAGIALNGSAAAADRNFADTDTAYVSLVNGDSGNISSSISHDWNNSGMTMSMDIKTKDSGNNKLDFLVSFSLNSGNAVQFEIYRNQQVLLKYGSKNYYYYSISKLNKLFGTEFDFNEWHNYKVKFISDGTAVTDIIFTIDGKTLEPSIAISDFIDVINGKTVTWCNIRHSAASEDVFLLDNFSITGKDKVLTEDFEEDTGIFNGFASKENVGNGIIGDLNQDGALDIIDLICMKKLSISAEKIIITDGVNSLADLHDDSEINAQDIVALRKVLILL